jgi:hypothetical protein
MKEITYDHDLIFFVNGSLVINDDTYTMRFLTESFKDCSYSIVMIDEDNNDLVYTNHCNGLQLIKVDCTVFMKEYNPNNLQYKRIHYKVYLNDNDIYDGSFPIISNNYRGNLKFGIVSCNNNKNRHDANTYSYDRVIQEEDLWMKLGKEQPDILFHLGDQIYADFIYVKRMKDNLYNLYANLYRSAYSEKSQGYAMRRSINLMMLGDHEIMDGLGTVKAHKKTNKKFRPYYINGMKAFIDYQYQLFYDLIENEVDETNDDYMDIVLNDADDIINGTKPIYYKYDYGKYTIIVLDERLELYQTCGIFGDKFIEWINNVLENTTNKDIIIASPRPICHLNRKHAYIQGLIISDGKDELLHPLHYDRTIRLLDTLYNYKLIKDLIIVSGDVHKTFINTITRKGDDKPFIKQLVSSAITRRPRGYLNFWYRIAHYIQQRTIKFRLENYTVSTSIKKSDNNNFGLIHNDMLDNYFIKDYNHISCKCLNYY